MVGARIDPLIDRHREGEEPAKLTHIEPQLLHQLRPLRLQGDHRLEQRIIALEHTVRAFRPRLDATPGLGRQRAKLIMRQIV